MLSADHQPLPDTPAAKRIRQYANDKLGAVYSALYSFWSASHVSNSSDETARTRGVLGGFHPARFSFFPPLLVAGAVGKMGRIIGLLTAGHRNFATRRDAYSIILFNNSTKEVLVNDLTSSPDDLLHMLLRERPSGSSSFGGALRAAETIMIQNWSKERLVQSQGLCITSPVTRAETQGPYHDFPFRRARFSIRRGDSRCLFLRHSAWVSSFLLNRTICRLLEQETTFPSYYFIW